MGNDWTSGDKSLDIAQFPGRQRLGMDMDIKNLL